MALEVTTEVVNESDGDVVLKRGNGGVFAIMSKIRGRGDRFTIKNDPNGTYSEYQLTGTRTSGSASPFYISSDDCLDNERIVIKRNRAGELRPDMIKRGMTVTEIINDTGHDLDVNNGTEVVAVIKARGEYLIQRDPKGGSETEHYSLVAGEKPAVLIPTQDIVNYQRLTVSGQDNPAVTSKVPRGIYLTEVFNETKTGLEVLKTGANSVETVILGSQSCTIEYDPGTKNEYWVQLVAEPVKEKLLIPPEYFVKGKRIEVKLDSKCSAGVKLESAVPRPGQTLTQPSLFWKIARRLGF